MYKLRQIKFLLIIFTLIVFSSFHAVEYVFAEQGTEEEGVGDLLEKTKRWLKIVEFLDDAGNYVERGEYSRAKEAVDEILKIDPLNEEAKAIRVEIDNLQREEAVAVQEMAWRLIELEEAEIAREKARREVEAKRETELAVRKKAEEEAEIARAEARKEEKSKREAAKARRETELAEAKKAKEEARIARAEARRKAKVKREAELAAKKKTKEEEKAAREKARRMVKVRREAKLAAEKKEIKSARAETYKKSRKLEASRNIVRAKKHFERGEYDDAKKYVFKAAKKDPQNPEILDLTAEINKKEMFADRVKEEAVREEKIEKAAGEATVDVFEASKGSVSWVERVKESFRKKKYELKEIPTGRVYTIDECVQIALRRNPRSGVSDKQIKLAEIRLWEAYRDLLPSVAAKHELSSGRIGANALVRHYRGNKYQVELKQVLFDGMEKYFAARQAKTNLDIVKLERKKEENEIIEETKKAYYSLDKAVKGHKIQEKFREKINGYYDVINETFRDDLVSRTEYLKVKAQNLDADFKSTSSGEDIKLAEMVLFQAMNLEPGQVITIEPVDPPEDTLPIGLDNCYALAFANEPDLRIKARVIGYYNFERKMKKAKGWPKIDFTGSFGASYENYEPLNIPGDYTSDPSGPARSGRDQEAEWYAGVKGSVPLWGNTFEYNYVKEKWAPTVSAFQGTESATSYFTLRFLDDIAYFSNLEEAKAGFARAVYDYDKAKLDLMLQIKEMYFQYKKSLLQMDIAKSHLEHQNTYVGVLEENWRFGQMEASRVIEELVKLSEYEYGVIQTDADYYISLVGLNKIIGIPDYFKPNYENKEFEEFKRKGQVHGL